MSAKAGNRNDVVFESNGGGTMRAILIENVPAPLYHRYPGQTREQSAFVDLDEDGSLYASWDPEVGGAVPAGVWHRTTIRIAASPRWSRDALEGALLDSERLISAIEAGWVIEHDGVRRVGRLTPDAEGALCELEERLSEPDEGESVVVWRADEWLEAARHELTARILGARDADPSASLGMAIEALASELEAEALAEGIHLDGSCEQTLRGWVEGCE